jgi:hypothetical protein
MKVSRGIQSYTIIVRQFEAVLISIEVFECMLKGVEGTGFEAF